MDFRNDTEAENQVQVENEGQVQQAAPGLDANDSANLSKRGFKMGVGCETLSNVSICIPHSSGFSDYM